MKPAPIDAERFVRNLYRGILRREPEPEALAHLAQQVANGAELNEIVEKFLNSPEFRSQRSGAPLAYPPGHFYSPVVDPAQIAAEFRARAGQPTPPALPGIAIDLPGQIALWRRLAPLFAEIPFPDEPTPGFRYHFQNPNFSYGDGSVLYGMLRLFKPKRLVEIGCGFSSACMLDTIERFLPGQVTVTFIEPFADLLRQVLGAATIDMVDLHEVRVQDAALDLFMSLRRDDVLFIDSTHVMKTGSDVCRELFEILPSLSPGVLIHIHDILWPFEYGEDWVLEENRSWNEIYGLRAFLMYNKKFDILFFNDYFRRQQRPLIEVTYPKFLRNTGGSLWLRKR